MKPLYYILSWTWGILLNIVGAIVFLVLMCCGYRPQRHAGSLYIEIGEHWGGFEMGMFFLCQKGASTHTKDHEFGHSLQNCLFGPLFPFLVTIPSATRYHYRNWCTKHGKELTTKYDDIWFEGQASKWGKFHREKW